MSITILILQLPILAPTILEKLLLIFAGSNFNNIQESWLWDAHRHYRLPSVVLRKA